MEIGRCGWVNCSHPLYVAYHDEEWGVPVHDDNQLFRMLILEGFQAGLSWECILKKRRAFDEAFEGFRPQRVREFDEEKRQSLMRNSGIVRNRRKIDAAVQNAAVFCDIQVEFGSFDRYLWGFVGGEPIRETGKTSSPLSDSISEDLKRRGMRFVGSVIVYSYQQAVGVINSHEPGCFRCPASSIDGQG